MVKLDYAKEGSQHKQKHHSHDKDSQGTSGPVLPCLQNKWHYSCTRLLERKNSTKMGKAHPAFWKWKVTTTNSNNSKYPCTDIPFASPSSNLAIQKEDFKVLFSSFQAPLARRRGEIPPTNLVICRKHPVLSTTTHLICRYLYPIWGHSPGAEGTLNIRIHPDFCHLCWDCEGSGSFCFTCPFKDQDQEFKGLPKFWGQVKPRRFNNEKWKMSMRVMVLTFSNKMKSIKGTRRRQG